MQVITVEAQKGGATKSTTVWLLAIELMRLRLGKVAMVDLDPQGSLGKWAKKRTAAQPAFMLTSAAELRKHIAWLADQGYSYVVIDTPPWHGEEALAATEVADLVIIPTQPSPPDLEALGPTIRMVKDSGKPFCFLLGRAKPNIRMATQAAVMLSQHGPIVNTFIGDRQEIPLATQKGLAAQEVSSNGKTALEVAILAEYVLAQLAFHATTD